jgi:hypothetical protein
VLGGFAPGGSFSVARFNGAEPIIVIRLDDVTWRDVQPIEWAEHLAHFRREDPLGSTHRWWVRCWRSRYQEERELETVDIGGEG